MFGIEGRDFMKRLFGVLGWLTALFILSFVNAPRGKFASAWVALADVSEENGCFRSPRSSG